MKAAIIASILAVASAQSLQVHYLDDACTDGEELAAVLNTDDSIPCTPVSCMQLTGQTDTWFTIVCDGDATRANVPAATSNEADSGTLYSDDTCETVEEPTTFTFYRNDPNSGCVRLTNDQFQAPATITCEENAAGNQVFTVNSCSGDDNTCSDCTEIGPSPVPTNIGECVETFSGSGTYFIQEDPCSSASGLAVTGLAALAAFFAL